jgi:hypothetical protein
MKQNWNDLNIKEKLAIISACLAFTIGWGLVICAAFVPILLSEQGVLFILGQALIYSASVFGVALYFKAESVQMKHDISRHIRQMERMSIEREKLRNGIPIDEIPKEEEEYD